MKHTFTTVFPRLGVITTFGLALVLASCAPGPVDPHEPNPPLNEEEQES